VLGGDGLGGRERVSRVWVRTHAPQYPGVVNAPEPSMLLRARDPLPSAARVASPFVSVTRPTSAASWDLRLSSFDDRRALKRPRPRTWLQRFVLSFNVILVVVCLASAAGIAFYGKQFSDIPRVSLEASLATPTKDGDPENFLLVGADNAEGLDASDSVRNGRNASEMLTDTIMILRVDPKQEKAWLLSLPRDTLVTIAGKKGRINSALALGGAKGGPELLINTIKENFGIPVHHFMQVNFFGFKQLVEALGGVNVYFNAPARDRATGLFVDQPGCHLLNGTDALAYARSRHYTEKVDPPAGKKPVREEDLWHEDVTNDHGRIARQQYFVKQALNTAVSRGARNPAQLNNLIGVAQNYVVLDDSFTLGQILDIGARFQNFDPDKLEVFEPFTIDDNSTGAAMLRVDEQKSQPMFNIFRGGDLVTNAFGSTRVEVRNGTGKVGAALSAANDLKQRGVTVTGTSDARNFQNDKTVIRYAPGSAGVFSAVVLARFLSVDAAFEPEPDLAATDRFAALVIGNDFTGILKDPRPVEQFAKFFQTANSPASPVTIPPSGKSKVTSSSTSTTAAPVLSGPPASVGSPESGRNPQSMVPTPPPGEVC
jgi:LCP family protein required for cell wall assembly